jgi:Fe2+ transport system protein B
MADDPRSVQARTAGSSVGVGPEAPAEITGPRPAGMLPRIPVFEQASLGVRESIIDAAEIKFPGKLNIDELDKTQYSQWIGEAAKLLRDDKRAERMVAQLSGVLAPGVEAEAEDIVIRRDFDFANERDEIALNKEERKEKRKHRQERREEEREGNQQKREIEQKKWDLTEEELRDALAHRNTRETLRERRERVFLVMTVIGALLAAGVCIFGVISSKGYVAGGSGTLALSILVTILVQVRHDGKQGMTPPAPAGK